MGQGLADLLLAKAAVAPAQPHEVAAPVRTTDRKDQQPPRFQKPPHPGKGRLRVGQMFQKMRRDDDVLTALWQGQTRDVADDHPGAP